MFLISDLIGKLDEYLDPEAVKTVYSAYMFAAEAHEGQVRITGEPYIYHPIQVAKILAEMRMDDETITAAILHDILEDTTTTKDEISQIFSSSIAELVDGVSKLNKIEFDNHEIAQAENFRKMLMAMVRDIRVIIIKLSDRLHNMRTLEPLRPDKQRRIARETLDIYVPIANRLGMNNIRLELEELGMRSMYPMRFRVLKNELQKARGHRKEVVENIEVAFRQNLENESVHAHVFGREKHLYSIYLKMCEKKLPFAEVYDVYAVRIIVENVDACYRVLGIVHNIYKPIPGKFKDYIAIPKANGYQSLHTILFGPHGIPLEVQIRTADMDKVAERGIAAHWLYKAGKKGSDSSNRAEQRTREWLQGLLEMQKSAGNSIEFLESVKVDLFPDEVYVFTPTGKIMELPRGATAVDFAYAVHTDIGNTCTSARINRRFLPLGTVLHNGDTVDIITDKTSTPSISWLHFVITAKARSNIRSFLKEQKSNKATSLGYNILEKELNKFGESITELPDQQVELLLGELGFESMPELLQEIGLGNRIASLTAQQLLGEEFEKSKSAPLLINGTEGVVINFARCCHPIPGDKIIAHHNAGRGLAIHARTCNNIAKQEKQTDRWVDVDWSDNIDVNFHIEIRVEAANKRGVLATVAATISEAGSNIENVSVKEKDGAVSSLFFNITVENRQHLARIMRRLRNLKSVLKVMRIKG